MFDKRKDNVFPAKIKTVLLRALFEGIAAVCIAPIVMWYCVVAIVSGRKATQK
jgi:hypothetical protein